MLKQSIQRCSKFKIPFVTIGSCLHLKSALYITTEMVEKKSLDIHVNFSIASLLYYNLR